MNIKTRINNFIRFLKITINVVPALWSESFCEHVLEDFQAMWVVGESEFTAKHKSISLLTRCVVLELT